MIALVLAELRARRRSLAGMSLGCFVALIALVSTYTAFGGETGVARSFGAAGISKVLGAFSGSASVDVSRPAGYLGFCFTHPIVQGLLIGAAVSSGASAVAADVESGRAEMLYTAPVSRTTILGARLIGWLLSQATIVTFALGGALLGSRLSSGLAGVSPLVPLRVAVQFSSLIFFLGTAAFAASARARTRGVALGAAIGVAAASYVANMVALLWSPAGFLRHFNPFGYYNAAAAADHINWPDFGLSSSASGSCC